MRAILWLGVGALLCVCLSGCLRYEEQLEFDAAGQGSARLVLSYPEGDWSGTLPGAALARFSRDSMARELPQTIGLTHETMTVDGRVEVTAVFQFSDVHAFLGWAARAGLPMGDWSAARTESGWDVSRRIGPLPPEWTAAEVKGDIQIRLRGPGRLVTTNAARLDGGTAVWVFGAESVRRSPQHLTAHYALPRPVWPWVVAGAAGLCVLGLWLIWRGRQRAALAREGQTN